MLKTKPVIYFAHKSLILARIRAGAHLCSTSSREVQRPGPGITWRLLHWPVWRLMLAVGWHPSWGGSYSTTIWPICIVLPLLHCLVIRLQEWAQHKPAEIAWPFLTLLQKSYSITTACILFLQAVTKAHSCSRGRGIRLHLFIGQVSIYRHVLKLPQENRQLPWDGKV